MLPYMASHKVFCFGACMMNMFIVCSIAAFMCMPAFVVCDDHIVGANHGWQVPSESGVDLNYSNWAAQQTFYLGDFISFHYQKEMHTVYEVNKTTYESCDFSSNKSAEGGKNGDDMMASANVSVMNEKVVHNWSTKGGRSIVPLNESRTYYFACGLSDHCLLGMKLAIHVLPLPSTINNVTRLAPTPSSSSLLVANFLQLSLLLHLLLLFLSP